MNNFSNKPVETSRKTVLILESDDSSRQAFSETLIALGMRAEMCIDVQHCASVLSRMSRSASNSQDVVAIIASAALVFQAEPTLTEMVDDLLFCPPILLTTTASHEQLSGRVFSRDCWGIMVKPIEAAVARHLIASSIEEGQRRAKDRQLVEDYRRRENSLSNDECAVLEAICIGKLNKQIARELGVSVRTIEQRRRRVFNKMGVASAAPLAERVAVVRTLERLHNPRYTPRTTKSPVLTLPTASPRFTDVSVSV